MNLAEFSSLLEELRASAQTGRNYAGNKYDQERYEGILEIVGKLYGQRIEKGKLPMLDNWGYVTPKVGVNAILENDQGEILLEKRKDDKCWCIIGGWCETHLTPEENIIREIKEETGYHAKILGIVKVMPRVKHRYYPYSSYHILYHCRIIGGEMKISHESEDVAFWNVDDVVNWHLDHKDWVMDFLKYKNTQSPFE